MCVAWQQRSSFSLKRVCAHTPQQLKKRLTDVDEKFVEIYGHSGLHQNIDKKETVLSFSGKQVKPFIQDMMNGCISNVVGHVKKTARYLGECICKFSYTGIQGNCYFYVVFGMQCVCSDSIGIQKTQYIHSQERPRIDEKQRAFGLPENHKNLKSVDVLKYLGMASVEVELCSHKKP